MLKDLWQYNFYVNMNKHKSLHCLPCPTSTILAYNILMEAHNHKRFPGYCICMWIFSSLINSFTSCIIDQCYVCQSLTKFSTYTFPYVVSSPTIRLAYDLFHLFSFLFIYFLSFYCNMKVKKAETQTKLYYISCTLLQG